MSYQKHRNSSGMTRPEITAGYLNDRYSELLDAVMIGTAPVSVAAGRIEPAQRHQLLEFPQRNGVLATITRAEVRDELERRPREMVEGLGRLAIRSPARFVDDMGQEIAIEQHALRLIRTDFGVPRERSEGRVDRAGGAS